MALALVQDIIVKQEQQALYLTSQVYAANKNICWVSVQHADLQIYALQEHNCSSRNLSWQTEYGAGLLNFGCIVLEQFRCLLKLDWMNLAY